MSIFPGILKHQIDGLDKMHIECQFIKVKVQRINIKVGVPVIFQKIQFFGYCTNLRKNNHI